MGLIVGQWGGSLMSAEILGEKIEIWSNSVSVSTPGLVTDTHLSNVSSAIYNYWTAERATLAKQVQMEWIKYNEFALTGGQITDPTKETILLTPERGQAAMPNPYPITTARRVSTDNGTRSRRAKGGWFSPWVASQITPAGRWDVTSTQSAADRAKSFLDAINAYPDLTAVVWSRKFAVTTPITRVRVGNVPDNISRRKNNMNEVYETRAVAP